MVQLKSRVFGIGLSRTGTTTLTEALKILGYASIHWPHSMADIDACEAATDLTVACRFENLDHLYPGSKFILTVREGMEWVDSCIWHYTHNYGIDHLGKEEQAFAWDAELRIYGPEGGLHRNRARYLASYDSHLQSVLSHFRLRPRDLLVINIMEGQGWAELCAFLGCLVPSVDFPHANRRAPS